MGEAAKLVKILSSHAVSQQPIGLSAITVTLLNTL